MRNSEGNGHVSRTKPIRARTRRWTSSEEPLPNGSPNNAMSPASTCCRPKATRMVVVLPAPLAPTNPTISPGATEMLTSRNENESLTLRLTRRISRRFVTRSSLSLRLTRTLRLQPNQAFRVTLYARHPAQTPVLPLGQAIPQRVAAVLRVASRDFPGLRSSPCLARFR